MEDCWFVGRVNARHCPVFRQRGKAKIKMVKDHMLLFVVPLLEVTNDSVVVGLRPWRERYLSVVCTVSI